MKQKHSYLNSMIFEGFMVHIVLNAPERKYMLEAQGRVLCTYLTSAIGSGRKKRFALEHFFAVADPRKRAERCLTLSLPLPHPIERGGQSRDLPRFF